MLRFLTVLFLTTFSSCTKKESSYPKQVARLGIPSDPTTLDPRRARDLTSGVILRSLFEGLLRLDQDGSIEMGIASDYHISEDLLTYTFSLRSTHWSDGTLLTSKDFIYAWKSVLDPHFPSDTAYFLYPIKNAKKAKLGEVSVDKVGIYAPDDQTLVVELEAPTPYFLDLLTIPSFFPVPESIAKEDPNWVQDSSTFVCNGPFCVDKWNHADVLSIRKNKNYWDSNSIHIDGADFFVLSQDNEYRMFEENRLDWAGSPLSAIPRDAIASLKKQNKLQVAPFLATQFCRLNTDQKIGNKENPLANQKFRKALSFSIDRSSIVNHILQGGQKVATGLVPPEIGISKEGFFADHCVADAKSLLKEALDEGADSEVVIAYFNSERNHLIVQALQRQWEENLGLKVRIEAIEPKVFFKRVSSREFQIALGVWVADFSDPINFLEVFKFKDNGTNNTGWENPKYTDLLNRSAFCKNADERKETLFQAEKILMDEMPIVPIFHFALNYVKSDALNGVYVSEQGCLNLRCASFDKETH